MASATPQDITIAYTNTIHDAELEATYEQNADRPSSFNAMIAKLVDEPWSVGYLE